MVFPTVLSLPNAVLGSRLRCSLRTPTACDASVSARYLLLPRHGNATGSFVATNFLLILVGGYAGPGKYLGTLQRGWGKPLGEPPEDNSFALRGYSGWRGFDVGDLSGFFLEVKEEHSPQP